jgi:hypothetical protein
MKKIILLAVALVSLATITSCSKDDDSASLQGKWEELKYGKLVNGQEVLEDVIPDVDGCNQDYVQITATNTIIHQFEDLGSGCEETIGDPVPYTRNGNIITSSDGTSEIKSLTGSTLKIYSVNDLGETTETNITILKRI